MTEKRGGKSGYRFLSALFNNYFKIYYVGKVNKKHSSVCWSFLNKAVHPNCLTVQPGCRATVRYGGEKFLLAAAK
jgi:hypothetical protein